MKFLPSALRDLLMLAFYNDNTGMMINCKTLMPMTLLASFLVVMEPPSSILAQAEHDDINYGPGFLHVRSQSPGQSLRMTMPEVLPGSIRPGISLMFYVTDSNIWAEDEFVFFDYEILDTSVGITYGFNERLGLAFFYDQRDYWGGFLDGFIEGFHDLFGVDQSGRDLWPRNQTWIDLKNQGLYSDDLSIIDNRAVTLLAQYVFSSGGDWLPAAGISGGFRYPLESPEGVDEGQPDWNVALGLSKRLSRRWFTCLHLGYTVFGQTDILGLEFESSAASFMLAFAWQAHNRFALLLQYMFNEAVTQNLGKWSDPSHELNLGFTWRVSRHGTVEFALLENLFTFDNSPDFGIHAGYEHHF